MIEHKLYMNDH